MEKTRPIHFECRDAARNRQRFYRLTVTRDLFGTVLLLREWGRIGISTHLRAEPKENEAMACRDAARIAARKRRRGYLAIETER